MIRSPLTSLATLARARHGAPLPDVGRACARSRSRASGRRGGGGRPAAPAFTPADLDNRLVWVEPRDASNTTSAGAFTQLTGLGGAANLTPFTTGPADATSDMLSGLRTALFNGSSDGMRNTSVGVPRSMVVLVRQVAWVSSEAIFSYGSGNRPQLRQSGVSNRVDLLAAGATTTQSGNSDFNIGYFRLVVGLDDGSANQRLIVYEPDCATVANDSGWVANANARATGPATFSVGAFVAGTFPTNIELGFGLATSDTLSDGEVENVADYVRREIVDRQTLPAMAFVGTQTSQARAQPRPYPTEHEGVSGNTTAGFGLRLCGNWSAGGGSGVTIGSASDPGAGARGSMETLATTRGIANMIPVVLIGTNDATGGAVPMTIYEQNIRRMWAIAGVGPGSILKFVLCAITGRTDLAGAPQGRIDTANAAIAALVATLNGDGIPAVFCDTATPFNTGTMLLTDQYHPNKLGAQTIAQAIHNTLVAEDLVSPSNSIVLAGDSTTEGSSAFVQATAQYRPWLARLLS